MPGLQTVSYSPFLTVRTIVTVFATYFSVMSHQMFFVVFLNTEFVSTKMTNQFTFAVYFQVNFECFLGIESFATMLTAEWFDGMSTSELMFVSCFFRFEHFQAKLTLT